MGEVAVGVGDISGLAGQPLTATSRWIAADDAYKSMHDAIVCPYPDTLKLTGDMDGFNFPLPLPLPLPGHGRAAAAAKISWQQVQRR